MRGRLRRRELRERVRLRGLTPEAWASAHLRRANPFVWWAMRAVCPRAGFRAFANVYGYFRWADDIVDAPGRDPARVRGFVVSQLALVHGERPAAELPEAALLAGLAAAPALRPAVDRMWEALAFDAHRGPDVLADTELDAQVARVGDAWIDALWWCAGAGTPPPGAREAARAATLVHVLRDRDVDRALGYRNGPDDPAWAAAGAAEAERRFVVGEAAIRGAGTWRARLLVRALVWKYRRTLRRIR